MRNLGMISLALNCLEKIEHQKMHKNEEKISQAFQFSQTATFTFISSFLTGFWGFGEDGSQQLQLGHVQGEGGQAMRLRTPHPEGHSGCKSPPRSRCQLVGLVVGGSLGQRVCRACRRQDALQGASPVQLTSGWERPDRLLRLLVLLHREAILDDPR